MWRIGFRIWSAAQYAKYAGIGGLALVLVWHAQGFSVLFWIIAAATFAVLYGARSALSGLARRESDNRSARGKR